MLDVAVPMLGNDSSDEGTGMVIRRDGHSTTAECREGPVKSYPTDAVKCSDEGTTSITIRVMAPTSSISHPHSYVGDRS